MDRLLSTLTVAEFIGIQAICFMLFYLAGIAIRLYEYTWNASARLMYWAGVTALFGLPVYAGLMVLFPVDF